MDDERESRNSRPVSSMSSSDEEEEVATPRPQADSRHENRTLLTTASAPFPPRSKEDGGLKSKEYSAKLHRNGYMTVLTFFYAALMLFAWIVTCILTAKPITTQAYGVDVNDPAYGNSITYIHSLLDGNETWFRAARVLQSIAAVLTIPLTSAVCSSAAVIYVQNHRKSFGLSLRQVMVLADRGWTDPATIAKIVLSNGWRRYGSSFLYLAILLNILGGLISPLQSLFLSSTTVKTPTYPEPSDRLTDLADQFNTLNSGSHDLNMLPVILRGLLATTTNIEPQALIWQGGNYSCNAIDLYNAWQNGTVALGDEDESCRSGVTFGNVSTLHEPFLAQLQSGYNTGVLTQFIPRVNSTAQYENISTSDFPANCAALPGSFFAEYGNATSVGGNLESAWAVQACMPADNRQSPWKNTRDRQDFSEELYINITLLGFDINPTGGTYKLTLNTTAGYFELPNYMNGQNAGPLLSKDPKSLCGANCEPEWSLRVRDLETNNNIPRQEVDNDNNTLPIENVVNKGPLLTTALALFGEGSFLANDIADPQAYAGLNVTQDQFADGTAPPNYGNCIDLAPFAFLLDDSLGQAEAGTGLLGCIHNNDDRDLNVIAAQWLQLFENDLLEMSNAFTAAAYLANQVWLEKNILPGDRTLQVSYDLGEDATIPSISTVAMIAISVLMGIYLLALLSVAFYSSISPRWTDHLDSFAMLRLGAVNAEHLPLLIGRRSDEIKALDELPGFVGDAAADDEVGRLGLGAGVRLRGRRRYVCFEGDNEK